MCLKKYREKRKEKKEIIEVMKFDISKSQYAIIFILYKLLHFVIIIHIKHALPPCQNIKACIRKIKGVETQKNYWSHGTSNIHPLRQLYY